MSVSASDARVSDLQLTTEWRECKRVLSELMSGECASEWQVAGDWRVCESVYERLASALLCEGVASVCACVLCITC